MKRGYIKRKTRLKKKLKKPKKPTVTKLKKKLWELCRQIIKKRYGNTCYTCYRTGLEGSNYQIGHYIPSSVCSAELRYSLENLRPQDFHCNINLSGNWPAYELHLLHEIGAEGIAELKRKNRETKGKKYDAPWYEQKIKEYTELLTK